MRTVYSIDTEMGVIGVTKKEYLYHKDRIINCHEDDIIQGGRVVQSSRWKEDADTSCPTEIHIVGYKSLYRYGSYKPDEKYSVFEQSILDVQDDSYQVIKLVDKFIKENIK